MLTARVDEVSEKDKMTVGQSNKDYKSSDRLWLKMRNKVKRCNFLDDLSPASKGMLAVMFSGRSPEEP